MIILASSSPRRAKLLSDAGFEFKIVPSTVDEKSIDVSKLKPEEIVTEIAKQKVIDVSGKYPDDTVIGADTAVFLGNEAFGKPVDKEDAFNMLKKLSGKTHEVITGVAIYHDGNIDTFSTKALVSIRKLTDIEIKDYVETGEPMDKAGSYAIQDQGGDFVEKYDGDFFTIVGLPLKEVIKRLQEIK